MEKRVLVPVLFVVALLTLIYAIYRSTAIRTIISESNRQMVYGEPQHGLILGLCLFSGICIASAVALLFKKDHVHVAEQPVISRRAI